MSRLEVVPSDPGYDLTIAHYRGDSETGRIMFRRTWEVEWRGEDEGVMRSVIKNFDSVVVPAMKEHGISEMYAFTWSYRKGLESLLARVGFFKSVPGVSSFIKRTGDSCG